MPTIVDDKEPTSTGVRLDQNAYNNMSKFGNMSKPKKNDEQDFTEEIVELEKSAARSVRSEPPPDEDGAPSAAQDSETRNYAGNMELNQQQQYTVKTTERAEPVEERILSSNPVSSNSGEQECKAVTTRAEPVEERIMCSTSAVPAAGETAAEVRRALCAGGGEEEEVVEAVRDVLGAQEQHWRELQGDFKFVEYLINPMQGH
jgi:hypothetical protein